MDPEEVVDLPIAEEEGDDEEEEENEGVEADVETGGETGEEGSGQESHDQSRRSRHAKGRTAAGVGSGDHREESDTELEQEDGPLSDDYSDNDGVSYTCRHNLSFVITIVLPVYILLYILSLLNN